MFMDRSLAVFTANGIHCICIEEHYREMKAFGLYHNTLHTTAVAESCAYHARMLKGFVQLIQ